jgi:hypothetical protein
VQQGVDHPTIALCLNCGYALVGGCRRCPECGQSPADPILRAEVRRSVRNLIWLAHRALMLRRLPAGWWWALDFPEDRRWCRGTAIFSGVLGLLLASAGIAFWNSVRIEVTECGCYEFSCPNGLQPVLVDGSPLSSFVYQESRTVFLGSKRLVARSTDRDVSSLRFKGRVQISERRLRVRALRFYVDRYVSTGLWRWIVYVIVLWSSGMISLHFLCQRVCCIRSAERLAFRNGLLLCSSVLPIIGFGVVLAASIDIAVRYLSANLLRSGPAVLAYGTTAVPAVLALLTWIAVLRSDRTGRLLQRNRIPEDACRSMPAGQEDVDG